MKMPPNWPTEEMREIGNKFAASYGIYSAGQESEEQAERICKMVNEAYSQGYRHAQWEMRKALGLDN